MKIGIVEYDGGLSEIFEKIVSEKIPEAEFKKKMALDIFDVLAFAKKFVDMDQLVIIIELKREEKDRSDAFFEGLAKLEADTGKNIFKCIFYDDEEGEPVIKELAETFINYLFYPEKLKEKKKKEEEEFAWLTPEETPEGEEPPTFE